MLVEGIWLFEYELCKHATFEEPDILIWVFQLSLDIICYRSPHFLCKDV